MYLLFIGVELAAVACFLFMTYDIFENRSGLNDQEKIEFIWKRAHQIQRQPVKYLSLFAVNLGYGFADLAGIPLATFVDVVNAKESKAIGFLVESVSMIGGGLIPVIVYLTSGGYDWKKFTREALLLHFLAASIITLDLGEYKQLPWSSDLDKFLFSSVPSFSILAIITVPFYYIGSRLVKPETCSLIETSARPAGNALYNRSFLTAMIPQLLGFLISFAVSQLEPARNDYWSDIIDGLGLILNLASASLTSILVVNHELHSGCFQWQWPAFLAPAIVGGGFHAFVSLVEEITVLECIERAVCYGTAGILADYIFLSLVDQHTKARLTLA